jgi:hypothetical protein
VTHPLSVFFIFPQTNKSSPKSSHVMMTPHHIFHYLLVAIKNGCEPVEIHPNRENCTRHCMSGTHALPEYHDGSGLYEIRIKGHLDDRWADRFEGLTITLEDDGNTLLFGPVADQAALHGLLKRIRDLGIPLVLVNRVQFDETHPYHSKKEKK